MSISTLPSMETTFTLNLKGTDTAKQYDGSFTYRRPNRRAKSEAAKLTARLNEDLKNLDEDTKFVHEVLGTLRFTLVESPEWWAKEDYGLNLYDENVIFEIYKVCMKFEREWTEKVWGNQEKAKEELKEAFAKEESQNKKAK